LLHSSHDACAAGLCELSGELRLSAVEFGGMFRGSGELQMLCGEKNNRIEGMSALSGIKERFRKC